MAEQNIYIYRPICKPSRFAHISARYDCGYDV